MTAAPRRRYRFDATVQRFGGTLIGGSPLKLFRVTAAGERVLDQLAAGDPVAESALVRSLEDAGVVHPVVPVPERGPYTPDDVTIVVPCHRTASGDAIRIPAGAVAVDDASPVPVEGATVRLERNVGPGGARNAGLALVSTPLVAFVDTDVDLPDGWLAPLLPHFSDDRVALVAPRVRAPATGGRLGAYEHERSPLDLGAEPARVRAGSRVSYVPAAAIVCRTDALRAVGGFDETLRLGEDVDLVWRLDAAGHRCRYEPAVEVHHDPRPTWRAWARQRVGYGSSAAPLARRHPGALAPLRMSGWSITTWALAMIGRPASVVAGVAVGTGSAAALVRKLPDVPPAVAFRLAATGNLRAGGQLAEAVRRVWWPIALVASIRSRTARRVLVASLLAARRPLVAADDVAYSVGVWRGVIAERTVAPLVPEISSWPGRRTWRGQAEREAPAPARPDAAAR
jgi:mycofactocin system glycosyltransferase